MDIRSNLTKILVILAIVVLSLAPSISPLRPLAVVSGSTKGLQQPEFTECFNFQYPWGKSSAAWGDFNNDGYLDLAIQGINAYITLYANQKDGTFVKYVEFTTGSTAGYYALDWGDCDNDGDLDLAVGSFYPGQNLLYINNGNGMFTQTPQFGGATFEAMDVEWGDYDNDGDLDLALANNTSQNYLYINNSDGTFTQSPQFGSRAKNIAWGDYDNDGDLDLAVASSSDSIQFLSNYLYINNGNGSFTQSPQFGTSRHSTSLSWGDFDNDGDLDLALGNENPYGNSNPQNSLYINNGNGTFTQSPQFGSYGQNLDWGDYDNDGDLDMAVGSSTGNRLYTNNGDGTFTESLQFGSYGQDIAWGDCDNDGDLDLITRDTLYRNQANMSACSITPGSQFFNLMGGAGGVNITAPEGHNWTAGSNANWIVMVSEDTGSGPGKIDFEVRENFTGIARQGTLTIAGFICTIIQDAGLGDDCSYSVSPISTSFSSSGGVGIINVFGDQRCAWRAVSADDWIKIVFSTTGLGNGSITYIVASNTAPAGRNGRIDVANEFFRVKQKAN